MKAQQHLELYFYKRMSEYRFYQTNPLRDAQ